MNVLQEIQNRFRAALAGLAADVEPFVAMVKPTQDARHGDYQANCAMSLAKVLGQKPRDVAQQVVERLELGDFLQKPEIAGPGFINLRVNDAWLASQVRGVAREPRLGVAEATPRKYVIDYSSPNVAKPMHVGHLRSTIIGDALARLLRFLGHTVIADNHLGDWGTQFGMLLYGYKHFLDAAAFKADPVHELARIYRHVRSLMSADEDEGTDPVAEACRQETAKLHAGDAKNLQLWLSFMPACLEEINAVYRRLDVHFDFTLGESYYNAMLPQVAEDLEELGIAQPSEGALAIFFGAGKPPAIVRKRDGAFTYTTTDLATIRYRLFQWQPQALLYVVDSRQALHFQNLFDAARRYGFRDVELQHISFGSVLGEDGKPIKTREGEAVGLEMLLEEAVRRAAEVYEQSRRERREAGEDVPEFSPEELRVVVEAIGLGAVKYADLSQNRTSDYTFSFAKMLAMNGNTGTYMQYAYARNRSIFQKAGAEVNRLRADPPEVLLAHPHERALALQVLRLEERLLAAVAEYQPSVITAYLWDLAKTYSGFYQNCPVIKAESTELRDSRLLLCDLTARVLQLCLELLGIKTVERM